jgi:hypothetical protein
MWRSLQIAWERTQDFFGRRALVVGSIPVVFWSFERLFFGAPVTNRILLLFASYAAVGVAVFLVQFLNASGHLAEEQRHQEQIESLLPEEQRELKYLIRAGKVPVGQIVLDRIKGKTTFIYRDSSDWRLEKQHEKFLTRWLKRNPL